MPALPGAPPGLSPGPSLTPLPDPGSALDSPASLLTEKGRSWARTLPLSPASTCHLPPQPQWARPKCVCRGVGQSQAEQGKQCSGSVAGVEVLWSPLPMVWGIPSVLSVQFMCLRGSLDGWGHLPVCVLSMCLCLGEVSRGPLPTWPSLCLCRSPKARTLSTCSSLVVLCLCVFLGAVACVSLCLAWLCCDLYESAPSVCPCGILSVHPSVGAVPSAVPERGRLRRSSANKLVSTAPLSPVPTPREGDVELVIWELRESLCQSDLAQLPCPLPSPSTLKDLLQCCVGRNPPVSLLPSPTWQHGVWVLDTGGHPHILGLVVGERQMVRGQEIPESHSDRDGSWARSCGCVRE